MCRPRHQWRLSEGPRSFAVVRQENLGKRLPSICPGIIVPFVQESTYFGRTIQIPSGFEELRLPQAWYLFRSLDRVGLQSLEFFDPNKLVLLGEESNLSGRGAVREFSLSGKKVIFRPYRHGGLLRRLRGRGFSSPERPFQEIALAQSLLDAGLPTAAPIAAVAVRDQSAFELACAFQKLEGKDLLAYFLEETDKTARKSVLLQTGELIARLHAWGLFHYDLHWKNLIWEKTTGTVHVLDLDRSSRLEKLTGAQTLDNLTRLYRFLFRRRSIHCETVLQEGEFLEMLKGYDAAQAETLFTQIRKRFHRWKWWHQLGWSLERL